jgi:serine protease Do
MEMIRRVIFAVLVMALGLALFAQVRGDKEGYGLLQLLRGEKPGAVLDSLPASTPAIDSAKVPLLSQLDEEYSRLAAAVLPSVVSVTTKTVRRGGYSWHPFFGLVGRQAQVIPGLGSGAIVSREGHVVTNFHVIEGVNEVLVTTQDEKQYRARVLGASQVRDIALLKIESNRSDFPALSFADSESVKVGQLVMAVGNPFGLSGTVTRGIISARDRYLSDSTVDYLQTDAVINPGNSGGPLVNVRGEILGINVAIYRGDENVRAWQGVGLAVPSRDVQAVINAILKQGDGGQGEGAGIAFLGINLASEMVLLDASMGVGRRGALIMEVVKGSPAEAAGLVAGDVIALLNGKSVDSPEQLLMQLRKMTPGQTITLTLVRESGRVELSVRLGRQND